MIKLFRNIRKKLLAEGNITKYLKYAIGEIVLVMIGILLALQVNTWNEDRKKQKLKRGYITTLIKDLSQDTLELAKSIKVMKADIETLKHVNIRISNNKATFDTLVKIARHEYNPFFNPYNSVNNITFKTLISTGNIDLLDPWLSEALLVLNTNHEQSLKIIDANINLHLSVISNYSQKYNLLKERPDAFGSDLFKESGHLDDYLWDNVNKKDLISEFNGLFTSKGTMEQIIVWRRDVLLKETQKLLDTINKVYKLSN